MDIQPLVGLGGDVSTFVGGFILAWDAVKREREFMRVRELASTLKDTPFARLKLQLNDIVLVDEHSIERAFIRQSALQAAWGCSFLTIGFVLLLIARILEMTRGV
jgi:hypothetical protein